MSEHLDELARALASGVSRRSALKRFLGAVFGLGGASLLARRAGADDPGRGKQCVDICRCLEEVLESEGIPFGQCVRLCVSVGPEEFLDRFPQCSASGISGFP
jgi:hypothetical protein